MAASLVPLPEIERLSSRVIRILGGNPGKFTLQGTNTYLLGTGPRRLLVDAAEGKPAWKTSLSSVLKDEAATVSAAVITHWHHDHVLGVPDLRSLCPGVKIYKFPLSSNDEIAKKWGYDGIGETVDIADGEQISVEGATVTAYHTPGHTTDHISLMLKEEDALFTGDNVLGQGTTVFEDLSTYLESLEKMLALNPARAYPAHGPVIEDAKAKITEYINHRKERENQVLQVLQAAGGSAMGSMDIVKVIYKDYPENLYEAAERGVLLILKKLLKDGKVEQEGEKWKIKGSNTGAGGKVEIQLVVARACVEYLEKAHVTSTTPAKFERQQPNLNPAARPATTSPTTASYPPIDGRPELDSDAPNIRAPASQVANCLSFLPNIKQ
ncbi:hypothetical protein Dda_9485 [Drechslerella dactyloides]|uniref:Metallo-beta-lactamase domain-containing protein n=1 Tax=Drechslerella dactyloides TaxID=74499 RepID=A0AAD6IRN1_DREDA|nr:hypothetical protein Dda_9485 [Drechslerella dactyloides]